MTHERIPPHSQEAELAVLGAIMLVPEAMPAVAALLNAADFYRADHAKLFTAFEALADKGVGIDVVTVKEQLRRQGDEDMADNADLFLTLGSAVGSVTNAEHYAGIVGEKAQARRLILVCTEVLAQIYDGKQDGAALVDAAVQEVLAIQQKTAGSEAAHSRDVILRVMNDLLSGTGTHMGVPYGYRRLDELTRGMGHGQMIVVGGRPSTGKTTFALNICHHLCVEGGLGGGNVLLFSAEMPMDDVMQNLLCCGAGVDSTCLRSGKLDKGQWGRVKKAATGLYNAPLYIDDTGGLAIAKLRARARRFASKKSVACIVIDYLQLLTCDSTPARASRNDEVTAISRGLKNLGRELRVPMLVLSQLSRASRGEHIRRPRLSDLRDSGSIEQDADVVLFLHHGNEDVAPAYDPEAGLAVELIVAKQRNGPRSLLPFRYYQHAYKFVEEQHAGHYDDGKGSAAPPQERRWWDDTGDEDATPY